MGFNTGVKQERERWGGRNRNQAKQLFNGSVALGNKPVVFANRNQAGAQARRYKTAKGPKPVGMKVVRGKLTG